MSAWSLKHMNTSHTYALGTGNNAHAWFGCSVLPLSASRLFITRGEGLDAKPVTTGIC